MGTSAARSVPTTRTKLREVDNDYDAVASGFVARAGGGLTGHPFAEPLASVTPPSVSIVVPSFNAAQTIDLCLRAIEASTFHEHHPHLLQVVVVDDGSSDDTSKRARSSQGAMNVEVVSRAHAGRATAMNTGIAAAEGDVVISCDADMLLTPRSIEALAVRHALFPSLLLLGFRSDVDLSEDSDAGGPDLDALLARPALIGDTRLSFDWPGWPENMVNAGDGLRSLGRARCLWMPSGEAWRLPRMVFGCLFSMRRSDLLRLDGYNEQFAGWGWEDTELASRAITAGHYVVPVFASSGHHVAHRARSAFQWREGARNRRLYQQLLDSPAPENGRALGALELDTDSTQPEPGSRNEGELAERSFASAEDAIFTGRTLAASGRTDEALRILDLVAQSTASVDALATAGALRLADGQVAAALESLRDAAARVSPVSTRVAAHLGLAEAAAGRFDVARRILDAALRAKPDDRLLRYVLGCPAHRHRRRGRLYAADRRLRLAARDFEAALVQDPNDRRSRAARDAVLAELAP